MLCPKWGCSQVGRIEVAGVMAYGWNRAHFGAWCVVSAPLILGMDLTDTAIIEPVIDIITNDEAIADRPSIGMVY